MPQMAPMWWLSLFIMFTMSLMSFNLTLYFIMNLNQYKNKNMIKINQKIWKW